MKVAYIYIHLLKLKFTKNHIYLKLPPAISGSAVATTLGKGFLAIRKAGHLCVETHTQDYSDYSGREKVMEVRVDVLKPGTDVSEVTIMANNAVESHMGIKTRHYSPQNDILLTIYDL